MKIVVCIKQVPDTTEIKLDPVTGTMIRDGVPSIMNPDDKGGLEMALALKDKYGAQVTVITMGPPQADDILREAFAMGADRAIHLSDRKFAGADTLATSNAIAGALRMLDFDLVITGRQAIDGDTAQVGPQIAEKLGLPQVTYVEEFEKAMDDDFNTADAIAAIFELVKYANTTATAESSKEYLRGLLDRIVKLGDVLGLILDKKEELLDADIEKLIEERQAARKAKDFARADAIRDELLEKGIILKDTREGVQWKKA